jgi:glycerol-3-phosphate acyltransferase PlsX
MHIGVKLVRDGEADAFITMGNSGAALAVATVLFRTIPGVLRAGLTTVIPTLGGNVVLNDIGVNADSKPEWLLQFAVMGSIYAERIVGIENPRVGLLSNGEEEGKGNDLVRDAAELLKASPLVHFIGNVEPKEVLKGETDVMIADGFTGNLFIKTIEATGSMLQTIIYEEIYRSWISKIGGLLARPALRRVRPRIDPMEIGGAILLGVNGVVIIGHGRSNPLGVKNAIRQARQAVHGEVVGAIREGLAETGIAASTGK